MEILKFPEKFFWGSATASYQVEGGIENNDWAHGFGPRFGLIEVDYDTMERRIRPSAWEYAKICKSNQLEVEDSPRSDLNLIKVGP